MTKEEPFCSDCDKLKAKIRGMSVMLERSMNQYTVVQLALEKEVEQNARYTSGYRSTISRLEGNEKIHDARIDDALEVIEGMLKEEYTRELGERIGAAMCGGLENLNIYLWDKHGGPPYDIEGEYRWAWDRTDDAKKQTKDVR